MNTTWSIGSRLVALCAALLLIAGMLAGCGKREETPSSDSSGSDLPGSVEDSGLPPDSSDATVSTNDTSGESSGTDQSGTKTTSNTTSKPGGGTPSSGVKVNKTGMPIVSGGTVQISIMLPRVSGSPASLDNLPFTKELLSRTGIELKYIVINENEQYTKKVAALTSGNLPDIFSLYGNVFSSEEIYRYSEEGVLAEVGGMLEEWAPNINKVLNDIPAARKAVTLSNGKMYGLPGIAQESFDQTWVINKKWLEDLGLSMPETTDEFYAVLKAFVNDDPNGNGKKDEQGFATWDWNPNMYNPWGLTMTWSARPMVVDEKGAVHLAYTTSNYREGIRFWKRCYDEGLIYKRALGTNYDEFTDLLKSGNVGCFIWPWAQALFSEAKLKDYVPFNFPKGSNTGNFMPGVSSYSDGIAPFRLILTNKCKNKEAAMRFLDYLYTAEGHMLKTYGPAGTFYTKVGNKYKMLSTTKNVLDYGLNDTITSYARHESLILERHESEMNYQDKWWANSEKQVKQMMTSRIPKYSVRNVMLNQSEVNRTKEIWEAMDLAGFGNWGTSAIMGSKNVETEWNTFQTDLQSRGAKELEKIYQTAFDRQYK